MLAPRSQPRWVWITAGLVVALAAWLLTERRGGMPATGPFHADVSREGAAPGSAGPGLGIEAPTRTEAGGGESFAAPGIPTASQGDALTVIVEKPTREPAAGLTCEWRDNSSAAHFRDTTDHNGVVRIPRNLRGQGNRFLRICVSPIWWLDALDLSFDQQHTLVLPATAEVEIEVVGIDRSDQSSKDLKFYVAFQDADDSRGGWHQQELLDGMPRRRLALEGWPHALSSGRHRIDLPAASVYSIRVAGEELRAEPVQYVCRPPARAVFSLVADPQARLQLVEHGNPVPVAGVANLFCKGWSTSLRVAGGVCVIPTIVAERMRRIDADYNATILLSDGRFLDLRPAQLPWDEQTRTCRVDVAHAVSSVVVATARSEDPRWLRGEQWNGSSFPIDGGCIGNPLTVACNREQHALRLLRLPETWSRIWLTYADGGVLLVTNAPGTGPQASELEVVRVLRVDFAKDVAPLVEQYGSQTVTFELKVNGHPETLAAPIDIVRVDNAGDCAGMQWRKVVVRGAAGQIIVAGGGHRVVVAQ